MPNQSLRQHVDPNVLYSEEQIIRVLDAVRLWPHISAITSTGKPDAQPSYNYELSSTHDILDRPLNHLPSLSLGQKQLLSLARAILRTERPAQLPFRDWPQSILLVDEATSSLDRETEELALELIDRHFTRKSHTVIMVTHNLDAVMGTLRKGIDCVVYMEAARIHKIEIVQ